MQHGRRHPLGRAEVRVAARQRQAVGFAHRLAADHLDVEREVVDHAADDRELLPVLLAEVGAARADEVEELRHHRGHPREVRRPALALERLGHLAHGHRRQQRHRVHLLDRRGEDQPDTRRLGRARRRGRGRADSELRSSRGPNCSGLTKTETTVASQSATERRISETCPRAAHPSSARSRSVNRRCAGAASAWRSSATAAARARSSSYERTWNSSGHVIEVPST